ncbi:hypothetical protein T484DRAFT_2248244 [Baffinella frigidus]|nr:hypothetical protein T484DRAFT_2248244 [Cryptophyta sp. CCMP2293]
MARHALPSHDTARGVHLPGGGARANVPPQPPTPHRPCADSISDKTTSLRRRQGK